tara:strand:- start:997 stop:1146 length:150 start_codon:yes stop_codon:yes gene_type:complete
MNKKLLIGVGVIGLAVAGFFAYGYYKKKKFDKDCLSSGGKILESGRQCE